MIALLNLLSTNKIFLSMFANLAATMSGLLLMAASAWLIASAAFHPPLSTLAVGITIVRAAGIFRAVFRYADRYLTHTTIFSMLTKLRAQLYETALTKFPLKSGITGEGELLHDLTIGCDVLKDFFPHVIQPLICSLILTIIVTLFLIPTIGGVVAIYLPVALILNLILSYILNADDKVNDIDYRDILLDINDGRDEIFIAGSIPTAIDKLNNESKNLNLSQQYQNNSNININSYCNVINIVMMIVILYNLINFVDGIDLAVWLLILLSMIENYSNLPAIINKFCHIKKTISIICADKIVDSKKINDNTNFAINVDKVNFGYSSNVNVLKNLDLNVKIGEQIAIIGESGSGKTTLLYLLLNLWPPDSGKIAINGSIMASTSMNYIFSTSIRDNFVMLNPDINDEQIYKCLQMCQLSNFNIDEEVGEDAARLSGGERCRLQTALALAADSDILILDEPTAGVDKITSQILIDNIIDNAKKKYRTLIIITHDISIAERMSTIYKLADGRLS